MLLLLSAVFVELLGLFLLLTVIQRLIVLFNQLLVPVTRGKA